MNVFEQVCTKHGIVACLPCPHCASEAAGHRAESPLKTPLETQIGGAHYKKLAIQPVEYIHANKLGFFEGSVIKYVTRWRDKGGVADLEKAKHFIDLLIQLETKETK